MTNIENFLIEQLHYEQYEVEITIEDIHNADSESQQVVEEYIRGQDVSNYGYGQYTVERLVNEKGFNTVAAILSIANLKKDYNKFDALYKRPIK